MGYARVGLTASPHVERAEPYARALEAVGLEVQRLPSSDVRSDHAEAAARVLDGLEGIVLSGGGDLDPTLQGRADAFHPTVYGVDPNRDHWERAVFEEAWRRDLPILAICRGMQLMNWSLGGTLYADIDALHAPCGHEKRHCQTDYGHSRAALAHAVTIEAGTRLLTIVGEPRLWVNSIHHQALREVALELVPTARDDDFGVIEAVEAPSRTFVIGVQFHPEEMWREHPPSRKLFEAFAHAARARAKQS